MGGIAARYERVSTPQQADKGTSLKTQAEANLEMAIRLGFDPDERYHLWEDESAANSTRGGLVTVHRWVEGGEVGAVFINDSDRYARDPLEILLFIRLCKANKVQIHFSCGRTVETAEDECLEYIRGYFGQREREKIMERTDLGKRRRAAEGTMPCGNSRGIYGYDYDPVTKTRSINEVEAYWVRQMYEWRVDGLSPHAIMKRLNDLGVPAKQGGPWHSRTVKAILMNPALKGQQFYARYRHQMVDGKRVSTPVPREKWIEVPGFSPKIVSGTVWKAVQETWEDTVSPDDIKLWDYFLTKHLLCGLCGRGMSGSTQKDESRLYPYYVCKGTPSRGGSDCTAGAIRGDFLEPAIWDHVAAVVRDPSSLIADLRHNWETGKGNLANQASKLRREIQKCNREETFLLRQGARGKMTESRMDELVAPVRALRSRHERDLSKLEEQSKIRASLDEADERIRACLEQYEARLNSVTGEERRALLSRLKVRVVATKERALVTAEIDPDLLTIEHTLA